MIVFLNGQFVPAEQAVVSVRDRGFLYGDGLFETMRVTRGLPFRWGQHWERLQRGADFLRLFLPFSAEALLNLARELIQRNEMTDGMLRLTVSRGVGTRGYSTRMAERTTVVMTLEAGPAIDLKAPPHWRLITSSYRVATDDPLLLYKTCNKLRQVLARAEADAAGVNEALLLNNAGHLTEASAGNLFWIEDNVVCTPPLSCGLLPGVTRQAVLEICDTLGRSWREIVGGPERLASAQGIFLTLSTWGLVTVTSLDERKVSQCGLIEELHDAYWQLVERETKATSTVS
jgi:aminodeoxychorismate lyase